MAESKANPGFGCTLAIGDGTTTEGFTVIAEVTGIPGFGTTQRTSEVTHMSSPNGWVEHIGLGLKEGKAFTVPLNFVADDTQHIQLFQTLVASGAKNNYQISLTDDSSSTVTFGAIVQDTDITHDRDSHAQGSVTFLPTGAFTWA